MGPIRSESEGPFRSQPYLDPSRSIEERVDDLLRLMTVEEKVAQVCAVSLRDSTAEEEGLAGKVKAVRDGITKGIGQIENTFDPRTPRESVEEVNDLQRLLQECTRLKIPALIGSECAHGHAGYNSTILPAPLAMASSWNVDLIENAFDRVARESRARGAHEAHTPVLDLGRDPRWGRIEETFGEDTYLVTQMGLAAVSGLQGGKDGNPGTTHVVASPKHFAGYGQVVGGRNFAATPVDSRTLHDEILPPFEAVVKRAKVQGMMASHCDVEGVPAHGNRWLLTELLREQWGFEGMVVSDYNDVPRLAYFQHLVESVEDAAVLALSAGVDLDLPVCEAYSRLPEILNDRPELTVHLDQSVRRILRLKFMLGLFEDPYADASVAESVVGCKDHVKVAERVACESVVLLKNEGRLLPLSGENLKMVAVIGPNAASKEVGNYAMKNDYVVSILEGIERAATPDARIFYQEGCKIPDVGWNGSQSVLIELSLEEELEEIGKAVDLAQKSDVAIVCVGGNTQTSREAYYVDGIKGDRATLGLLGNQEELVNRILGTGRPTVIVLMGGRPLSIPNIAENADAILNTFYLGQANGTAVAKVLFGEVNPSGKLPVTVPRSVGQLPVYYSQKEISFYKDYLDEKPGPLYPFGFGLSYTTFAYSDFQAGQREYGIEDIIELSVKITNTGDRAGAEVVQLYFSDTVASIVRPSKLLVRFQKIHLESGEGKTVKFVLDPQEDLAFTGVDLKQRVEPGRFEVMVGSSSKDIRGRLFLELKQTRNF